VAKNNKLIKQYKKMYQQIHNITPEVYAGIALALSRKHGWGYDEINELFCESQNIWTECVHGSINMIDMCERETGIELKSL
jgi:hypothetical protein